MQMGEAKQMHVVMLAFPVIGHINPMLQASLKLASKGVKVTFVNSEYNKSQMKLPLILNTPASSSCMEDDTESSKPYPNNISFLYIPDGLPPEHGRTTHMMEMITTLDACYGPAFEELLQGLVLQDPPVTCIISNTFISHVQDAVKRLCLPFVSFWSQSAASYASLLMLAKGKRPPKDALPSDAVARDLLAPGIPHIKYKELSVLLLSHEPDNFAFKLLTSPFKNIVEADGILMNTFEELEAKTIRFLKGEGHPVMTVGPLLPDSFFNADRASQDGVGWTADEEQWRTCCPLRWLDRQEADSVIYVSFGSLAVMSAEQMEEIAMGLEASKQAFLWVVRRGPKKEKVENLPEGFLERTSEQGLVIPWAPQLSVLRHQAVGGFLTHCGWNSTLEGISAGMPLLCWPCFSEQALNCRFAVDKWHVGLSLEEAEQPAGLVLRTEIERKVVTLIQSNTGKALRANAREWRTTAIKSASHSDGSSVINLQCFVDRFSRTPRQR